MLNGNFYNCKIFARNQKSGPKAAFRSFIDKRRFLPSLAGADAEDA